MKISFEEKLSRNWENSLYNFKTDNPLANNGLDKRTISFLNYGGCYLLLIEMFRNKNIIFEYILNQFKKRLYNVQLNIFHIFFYVSSFCLKCFKYWPNKVFINLHVFLNITQMLNCMTIIPYLSLTWTFFLS